MARKYQRFTYQFIQFVNKFLLSRNISFPGTVFIAVSGGADSMALLALFKILHDRGLAEQVIALHVNHGTRQACDLEEEMIRAFCREISVEVRVKHLRLGGRKRSNFEKLARNQRYEFFEQQIKNDGKLLTAHHLDDSFEWSLMQQLKSSKLSTSLGIPLVRGQVIRPFLCVTKSQIRRLIKQLDIPYMEDLSNQDISYERNYLRKFVIPHIKKQYPQYLKHYVHRQNSLAKQLGLEFNGVISSHKMRVKTYENHLSLIFNDQFKNEFLGDESLLISQIEGLANSKRGTLAKEVRKLVKAFESNKVGPMLFSGGVRAYIFKGAILLVSSSFHEKIQLLDEKLSQSIIQDLARHTTAARQKKYMEKLVLDNISQNFGIFGLLEIGKTANMGSLQSIKSPFLLFFKTSKVLIENHVWHQSIFRCISVLNKLDSLNGPN